MSSLTTEQGRTPMYKLFAAAVAVLTLWSAPLHAEEGSKIVVGLSNGYFGTEWRTQMIACAKPQSHMSTSKRISRPLSIQQASADPNQHIQDSRNMIQQHVSV